MLLPRGLILLFLTNYYYHIILIFTIYHHSRLPQQPLKTLPLDIWLHLLSWKALEQVKFGAFKSPSIVISLKHSMLPILRNPFMCKFLLSHLSDLPPIHWFYISKYFLSYQLRVAVTEFCSICTGFFFSTSRTHR